MTEHFDVVVLGTGNAGMAAAGVVREAGRSVAMVESRDVGGTCPIRGCVPKKVLVAAAQVLHQIELAPQHHIKVGRPELDALRARVVAVGFSSIGDIDRGDRPARKMITYVPKGAVSSSS